MSPNLKKKSLNLGANKLSDAATKIREAMKLYEVFNSSELFFLNQYALKLEEIAIQKLESIEALNKAYK